MKQISRAGLIHRVLSDFSELGDGYGSRWSAINVSIDAQLTSEVETSSIEFDHQQSREINNNESFLDNDGSVEYPLVSVVICTYNRSSYLDKCITSLLDQSYSNVEIVVVNGPSTDDTEEILDKYKTIKIVNQIRLEGLSAARNLGIKGSHGEIVAFIDDDAVADKDWLKLLIERYKTKDVGGVGGLVYGPNKSHVQFNNGIINKYGKPTPIRNTDMMLNPHNEFPILMGTNCSFKKGILCEVGGFDPYFRYYHDESDLCVRIVKKGYRIIYNHDAFVIHEMAEGHNRLSTYDLNWYEIMKNVIYFILKNFKYEINSYTIRPIIALFPWFKYAGYLYLKKEKSTSQFLIICIKLIKGAMRGYMDGLNNMII